MALPKGWYFDPRVTEAYSKQIIITSKNRYRRFHNWEQMICKLRQNGFKPKESIHRATAYFVKAKLNNAGIPKSKKWAGNPSAYDEDCSVCNFLVKCGVIKTPGRLRYLGEFYAGKEKVCKEFYDEDGGSYTKDVEFGNYLAGWRCDVCGNENTDGY